MTPKFSVIIPTFNRAKYVTKAVESVLRQPFRDYEIIVVDDGSSDNTRAALFPYLKHLHYIYQENRGVSEARNAGIHSSTGSWISFLDSDDEWLEDYFSTQLFQMREFPRAIACVANGVTVYRDGKRSDHFGEIGMLGKFHRESCWMAERPLQTIMAHSHWFLQSTTIRRDVLLRAGLFKTHLSIAEDLDVIARSALMGPFSFCRKVVTKIYRRDESIENLASQRVKRGLYTARAFGEVYTNLLNLDLTFSEKMAVSLVQSRNLRAMGNLLLRDGKRSEARELYRRSFLLRPSIRSAIKYFTTFLPHKAWDLFLRSGRHILPGEDR